MRLCILALILAAAQAVGQTQTATLVGAVRDSTGAVVPGAKVTVINTETAFRSETITSAWLERPMSAMRTSASISSSPRPSPSLAGCRARPARSALSIVVVMFALWKTGMPSACATALVRSS